MQKLVLDAAETVLGFFGFDMAVYSGSKKFQQKEEIISRNMLVCRGSYGSSLSWNLNLNMYSLEDQWLDAKSVVLCSVIYLAVESLAKWSLVDSSIVEYTSNAASMSCCFAFINVHKLLS